MVPNGQMGDKQIIQQQTIKGMPPQMQLQMQQLNMQSLQQQPFSQIHMQPVQQVQPVLAPKPPMGK